jgi:MoaA/NifB/PqqE/SkfB family radical SAM enzyme
LRAGVWRPATTRRLAPARPVGAKLELLYACNLRCTFCYTDSPRHTMAGTASLSDDEWRRVVDEALELGVVEVVLTGGEPLMRADLVLELLERISSAGVGLTLNTNGWFLDDEFADRLAGIPGLTVDVSIDGPTPELHDAGRGVPGSWRRAVLAVDRLLSRGIRHQVVSVVTPQTLPVLDQHIERMRLLGVRSLRLTPVAEIGAAARLKGQHVSRSKVLAAVERHQRSHGEQMRLIVQYGNIGLVAIRDRAAPAALLVRPNGAVLTDSLQPFAYGNAVRDGLASCWQRIREGWGDERIDRWARSISSSGKVREATVVPYLSDELDLTVGDDPAPVKHLDDPLPRRAEPTREPDQDPVEMIRHLALRRRYTGEAIRVGGGGRDTYVRRLSDGRVIRVNETALTILEALDGGSASDAVDRLGDLYPGVGGAQLEADVLEGARALLARGFVRPAGAREGASMEPVRSTPDLPGAVPGVDAAE